MSRLDDLFAPLPTHLSVEQLGQVLGVTTQTAYRWLQRGYVPGYKVGGGDAGRQAWVIVRDEVKDHLLANRNSPLQELPGPDAGDVEDQGE